MTEQLETIDLRPNCVTRLDRLIDNYLACDPLDPIATIAFIAAAARMCTPFLPAHDYCDFGPDDGYWQHWYEGRGVA